MPQRVVIGGVPIDNVDSLEALRFIFRMIDSGSFFYVTTPNPEFVLAAQKDAEFLSILQHSALSIPDGTGLLWAASILQHPFQSCFFSRFSLFIRLLFSIVFFPQKIRTVFKARVAGTDLMGTIVFESVKRGLRIFLLGGASGVAEQTKRALEGLYPGALIVGTFSGDGAPSGDSETVERVISTTPDIVFVAYGAPKQEKWIHRNSLKIPSLKMAMGVGGAFDFISGKCQRAPLFFHRIGLEWLWRFFKEPRRAYRIFNATLRFIFFIAREQKKLK